MATPLAADDEQPQQVYEVSRNPGVSLQEAINETLVAAPELMDFNEWLAWRKTEGRRPTLKVDGIKRGNGEEAMLWKYIMEAYYGPSWAQMVADKRAAAALATDDESEEEAEGGEAARSSYEAAPPIGSVPTPAVTPNLSVKSDSWNSQLPGSPTQLKERLGRDFDPTKESSRDYLARLLHVQSPSSRRSRRRVQRSSLPRSCSG